MTGRVSVCLSQANVPVAASLTVTFLPHLPRQLLTVASSPGGVGAHEPLSLP